MSATQEDIRELRESLSDSREKGAALGKEVAIYVNTTKDGFDKMEKRQDKLLWFLIGQLVMGLGWLGGLTVKLLWFGGKAVAQ